MGALPFVWWRGAVGTLVMLGAIAVLNWRGSRTGPLAGPWLPSDRTRLLIASMLGAFVNIAMFAAFVKVTIAVALITFYTFPALVTLLAVRFYGERLTRVRAGALLLSATGLVLVVLTPVFGSSDVKLDPVGIGLAAGSALCQASFLLIAGRGFAPLPPSRVTTYVLFAAAAVAFVLALVGGDVAGLMVPFQDPQAWVWILLGGVTGAAIPTTAFITGIGLIGPSRAAILMTLEPLVAITLAALLLGERPSLLQVVGGAAVLAAAVILQLAPRGRAAADADVAPVV